MEKIRKMNGICTDMTSRIQSNKERTRDLLKKTAVLQNEKYSKPSLDSAVNNKYFQEAAYGEAGVHKYFLG